MANRLLSRLLIIAACICAWAELAWAERKVAIVIGNSSYEHSQPLKNPVNDAKAVTDLFKQLGYEVELHLDVDRVEFTKALGDFHQTATSADAAIFYYAGHGVSVDGRNYLVPVDSDIQRLTDVKLGAAIDAELAIEQALADAKVKLVFLDACRDNPFVEQIKRSLGTTRSTTVSSGLSEMKSGAGTLIAFSTAPGQVAFDGDGNNSPFADALIMHLSEPGLEIRLAMTKVRAEVETITGGKQTPWESTNLTGFYYFSSPTRPPEPMPSTTVAKSRSQDDSNLLELQADTEFWQSIKDSGDPDLLNAYLRQFPNGRFRVIAEKRLSDKSHLKQKSDHVESANALKGGSPDGDRNQDNVKKPNTPEVPSETAASGIIDEESAAQKPKTKNEKERMKSTARKSVDKVKSSSADPKNTQDTNNAKPPQKSSNAKTPRSVASVTDESAFLSRKVQKYTMGKGTWVKPPGVTALSEEDIFIVLLYKGRKYRCVKRTENIGGTYCSPK